MCRSVSPCPPASRLRLLWENQREVLEHPRTMPGTGSRNTGEACASRRDLAAQATGPEHAPIADALTRRRRNSNQTRDYSTHASPSTRRRRGCRRPTKAPSTGNPRAQDAGPGSIIVKIARPCIRSARQPRPGGTFLERTPGSRDHDLQIMQCTRDDPASASAGLLCLPLAQERAMGW